MSCLSPAGSWWGRVWRRLSGQEMDQDCRTNGFCSWESCRVSPARALWENPLSLQSVPERRKPAGQLYINIAAYVFHGYLWRLFCSLCFPVYVFICLYLNKGFLSYETRWFNNCICLGKSSEWHSTSDYISWCPFQLYLTALQYLILHRESAYLRLCDWCCVAFCPGHAKLCNYPSSLLPQAPEAASKQMSLEADPEPEEVGLCRSQKLLGVILAQVHVFAFTPSSCLICIQ